MAIETQQISADNVIETIDRVFATPEQSEKVDLINVTSMTDLDSIVSQVNAIQNPIQNKGDFDASVGTFPTDADSGWLYRISVGGTIDGLEMTVGDVIFAIGDVTDTSSSSMWVKIDNTDGADILRQTILDADALLGGTSSSDSMLPTQKAVKTYVDTSLDALNTQLMDEINLVSQSAGGSQQVVVSDWIDILDDGFGGSVMTLLEPATGIVRIYIEDWGDIIKGWTFTEGTEDIIFESDVTHTGKRCVITYLK